MVNPIAQSGFISYNINHYTVDEESEIDKLPTYCETGSSAKVISTGDTYILNSKKKWIKQPASSSGSSSDSGSDGSTSTEEGDIVILNGSSSSTDNTTDDSIIIL